MSARTEKVEFQTPSLYSSTLFRIVHQVVKPANFPAGDGGLYYGAGNEIVFNLSGASNEMIIPSTAFFCTVMKVHGDNTAIPSNADNAWTGQSTTGLPRVDFGIPNLFSSSRWTVNSSQEVQVDIGQDAINAYYNGCLACSPFPSHIEPMEIGTYGLPGEGGKMITKTNGAGVLEMCNFRSDWSRLNSFSGMYRAARDVGNPITAAGGKYQNGGIILRAPLSLWCGLFHPSFTSTYIPIGMLAQNSASGITARLQLGDARKVIVDGKASRSILLSNGEMTTYALNAAKDAITKGTTAADGVGASASSYGLYTPTIVYKSLIINDAETMAVLDAIFQGGQAENLMFGGLSVSIPRNLFIKYPAHHIYDYVHRAGTMSSFYDIPCQAMSLKGVMLRFLKVSHDANESKTVDWFNSQNKSLVVKSLAFKIGATTYPMQPIVNNSSESLTLSAKIGGGYDVTDIPSVTTNNTNLRRQNLLESAAIMSCHELEGKHCFSPWSEFGYTSLFENNHRAFQIELPQGVVQNAPTFQLRNTIHPFTFSFENSNSSLEQHELTHDQAYGVRGIRLFGIGSIRLELTVGVASGETFAAPGEDVRVMVSYIEDRVMSVQRGNINPKAEYQLFE